MKIINKTAVNLPISLGDVIIKNVFGSNVMATQTRKRNSGTIIFTTGVGL